MDLSDLAKPFPKEAVHWRIQGSPFNGREGWTARALAYLDARDVMDRLDEVCGPAGWQSEISETPQGRVICRLGIRTDEGWVWKSDGAGKTAVEGEKGGISDALKRAAVPWGVGRYLYRLDSPRVKCRVRDTGKKKGNGQPIVEWKGWDEDPWSKVKQHAFVPTLPEEPDEGDVTEPMPAAPPPERIRDRLKAVLNGKRRLPDLVEAWKDMQPELLTLPKPMQLEVTATKDTKKRALTGPDPAMQAPQDSDRVPA